MAAKQWLIYGATGYTAGLICQAAKRRGLQPILAGRNVEAVRELAASSGLEHRAFGLEDHATICRNLAGVHCVLHCAGPFSATAEPMVAACLEAGAHYLDITGEIAVFEAIFRQDARAKSRGVLLMPGVGFDIVPTDCLALKLKQLLPDGQRLALAFASSGRPSRGTAKSMVEGWKIGGRIRENGRIVTVPLAYKTRTIRFSIGEMPAVTIPWGDVSTAYYTTGIPNIEVYLALPLRQIQRLRRLRLLRPLLARDVVQRALKAQIARRIVGPTAEQRERAQSFLWGEISNDRGAARELRMVTPNGYDLTVNASLAIVEHLLQAEVPAGARTPASVMGADFVTTLPGVTLIAD